MTFMNSVLFSHHASPNSPIGIVVKQSLLMIETYTLFSIRPLIFIQRMAREGRN